MKKNKTIQGALQNALGLLNEEYQTVIDADLREQYKQTINEIEKAITIMETNNKVS
ncbi:MAG: hypothetical protein PHQ00_03210 [Phycisphaerae bacterium]|nr:hypothetical protein [Phycisphaerae bacterium]